MLAKLAIWTIAKRVFSSSETIVFARLQLAIGALFSTGVVNPKSLEAVLPSNAMAWWLIISGILTAILRKMRDPELKSLKSETMWWALIQTAVGATFMADWAPVLPVEWLPVYTLISGAVLEFLRRLREPHYNLQ